MEPVAGDGEHLVLTSTCSIPLAELEWRFDTSGGPGGQHANVSRTRAEVRFDVEASTSLGDRERRRLVERLGPVVTAVAGDARSQSRNRALALERLTDRLASALADERPRRPSAPTRSSRQRRLDDKTRRGEIKRLRRPPAVDPE